MNDEEFTVWVQQQPQAAGHLGVRGAMLKTGPQVAKAVSYAEFGDSDTGEVRRRELRFRTVPRRNDGPGFDFDKPRAKWHCENDEIDRLLAFLHTEVHSTGRFRLVDSTSPQGALIDVLKAGDIGAQALVDALFAEGNGEDLVRALSRSTGGLAAAESAIITQRRDLIAHLQDMARNPATTESDMLREMGESYWLFGGRYVGVADRRNLAMLDQHDVPLLGADGTLHIVELKGPNIARLVRQHRNHFIVGNEVHEAVSQAVNYVRSLDEQGSVLSTTYRNEFGWDYDMRRVFATVVIGHPTHVRDVEVRQVEQTVRTYNAHLSRVDVITWATLLDAAERALDFEQEAASTGRKTAPVGPAAKDPWAEEQADPWSGEPPF